MSLYGWGASAGGGGGGGGARGVAAIDPWQNLIANAEAYQAAQQAVADERAAMADDAYEYDDEWLDTSAWDNSTATEIEGGNVGELADMYGLSNPYEDASWVDAMSQDLTQFFSSEDFMLSDPNSGWNQLGDIFDSVGWDMGIDQPLFVPATAQVGANNGAGTVKQQTTSSKPAATKEGAKAGFGSTGVPASMSSSGGGAKPGSQPSSTNPASNSLAAITQAISKMGTSLATLWAKQSPQGQVAQNKQAVAQDVSDPAMVNGLQIGLYVILGVGLSYMILRKGAAA